MRWWIEGQDEQDREKLRGINSENNLIMGTNKCKNCGSDVKNYNDSIMALSEDGYICLCLHCYNKEMSEATGIDYDHIKLQPVILQDADGVDHKFHFSIRLMGEELVLRSFETEENRSGGYEFSMIGDIEDGLFSIFSKLYARMLKALSRKHIYLDENTKSWQITKDDIVRGNIICDSETGDWSGDPMIVIDGKGISWKELGQMLMTYEGGNLKLQIFDNSDEMD